MDTSLFIEHQFINSCADTAEFRVRAQMKNEINTLRIHATFTAIEAGKPNRMEVADKKQNQIRSTRSNI
ncbi:MAG: hypothetical protein LBL24_00350 [Bacteroidales bacterium]|jgi:hypothetical protein|nr:hypothetical protein [Bacteroidales bacterium]